MSKPTLGYPSRTEAILALRAKGMTMKNIAAKMGIPKGTVSSLCFLARQAGKRSPFARVEIEKEVLNSLTPHAEKRNLGVNALAAMIVKVIVEGGLIDAVLDDGPRVETGRG